MDGYRAHIYALTHGDPPNRACFSGSDAKWNGYLLGVEEAMRAGESWHDSRLRGAVDALRAVRAELEHEDLVTNECAHRARALADEALHRLGGR